MIDLAALARLAAAYPEDLERPVEPFTVAGRAYDTDRRAAIMGVVNLSRDSWYRTSVAPTTAAAVRRGRTMAAQGADFVDVGAESVDTGTARVGADDQVAALVPVIEELADAGVVVSVESYEPAVVKACLAAGARILNLTGSADDDAMFDLAAEHDAALVLCHILGDHAREVAATDPAADPVPEMIEQFQARVATARERGVTAGITIDPGIGFALGNLVDPVERARHQSVVLLNTFRLRRLGLPLTHALPSAYDLFEEEMFKAEGFFAVLAALGGTGIFRTHEVPHVAAVLRAMRELPVQPT